MYQALRARYSRTAPCTAPLSLHKGKAVVILISSILSNAVTL